MPAITKERNPNDVTPYLAVKNVILCRSGYQKYGYNDVLAFGLGEPRVKKDEYIVYTPASTLIEGMSMMVRLPITKEHPPVWVDSENYNRYAHGQTGTEVDIVRLDDGEVGVRSDLSMNTSRIYDYYASGCSEVSLGYKSDVVVAPEGAEYDYIKTRVVSVNHLAITALGRGGSAVAIIDSLLGGLKNMKSGFLYYLSRLGKMEDSPVPFSKKVFDAIEQTKGKTDEEVQKLAAPLLDSLATMKDSDTKALLVDVVSDFFKAPEALSSDREVIGKFLDSKFQIVEQETLADFKDAAAAPAADDKKADDKKKDDDADDKKKADMKDGEDGKGKGTANISDSALDARIAAIFDSKLADIDKKLDALVLAKLGLKPGADSGVGGVTVDLTDSSAAVTGNYDVVELLDNK